jgi:hypothetical protein
MARVIRVIVGAAAAALALAALTACGSGDSGPMTPDKLAQKMLDQNLKENTANPMTDVTCDPNPQSVQADGSGTYDCTEIFQSGGEGSRTVTVNPDGSWS